MAELDNVAAGIAWLRKVVTGEAGAADLPSTEVLTSLQKFCERRSQSDAQRDANEPLPDTIEVKLRRPLTKVAGGDVIKVLTFRTPKWSELKILAKKAQSQGEIAAQDQALDLLVDQSLDLTKADFDQLAGVDAQRCIEALKPFLGLEPQ